MHSFPRGLQTKTPFALKTSTKETIEELAAEGEAITEVEIETGSFATTVDSPGTRLEHVDAGQRQNR